MSMCANCGKELGSEESARNYSCPKLPKIKRKFSVKNNNWTEVTKICDACVASQPKDFILDGGFNPF